MVALARAYGELGTYDQAILLLHRARDLHASALTFRDLEQLANFHCRYALDVFRASSSKDTAYSNALMDSGIILLKGVLNGNEIDATSTNFREVFCLLGSASRRRAVTCDTDQIVDQLNDMCRSYGNGWLRSNLSESQRKSFGESLEHVEKVVQFAEDQNIEPVDYAFTNYMLGSAIRDWFENEDNFRPETRTIKEVLVKHTELTEAKATRRTRFWQEVGQADLLLAQLVDGGIRAALGGRELDAIFNDIEKIYEDARKRFGSARQWLSIYDLVLFVRKVTGKAIEQNKTRNAEELSQAMPYILKLEKTLFSYAGKDIYRPTPPDLDAENTCSVDERIKAYARAVIENADPRNDASEKPTTKQSATKAKKKQSPKKKKGSKKKKVTKKKVTKGKSPKKKMAKKTTSKKKK